MPNSQGSDADNSSEVNNANTLDNKPTRQENQTPPSKGLKMTEKFLVEQARMADFICVFLIIILIVASVVTFCSTRSMLSFSFLPFIPWILSIRRRKEEAIFPISTEDLQIKLKELDVEMEKIRKQNAPLNLPLFSWLKRVISR
jgi:hypothetical protein